MEQRNLSGKSHSAARFGISSPTKKLSAEELSKLYQEHTEKHRNIQRKADHAQRTILLAQQIFKELHATTEFIDLLESENLSTTPKLLSNNLVNGEIQ